MNQTTASMTPILTFLNSPQVGKQWNINLRKLAATDNQILPKVLPIKSSFK